MKCNVYFWLIFFSGRKTIQCLALNNLRAQRYSVFFSDFKEKGACDKSFLLRVCVKWMKHNFTLVIISALK